MRILLAIHPSDLGSEESVKFLSRHFEQDPKTFLVLFVSNTSQQNALLSLKRKFQDFKGNFISIKPNVAPIGNYWEAWTFSLYEKPFMERPKPSEARPSLKKNLRK